MTRDQGSVGLSYEGKAAGYLKTLLSALFILTCLLGGTAMAQNCVQNGGNNTNCVPAEREYWEGHTFDGTNLNVALYDTKIGAIQGTATAFIQSRIFIDGKNDYNLGVQWAPFDYLTFGNCASPATTTDNTFTDAANPISSLTTVYIRVEVHGKTPSTSCPGSYHYHSLTGQFLLIRAVIGCPRGYWPVDEKGSGPRSTTFPYDNMCWTNHSNEVDSSYSQNDSVPDCQTAPTRGCTTTDNPVVVSNGRKNEQVQDLIVQGPWPLSWTRVATNESFTSEWIMPGNVSLVRGRRNGGTFSGRDVISIKRRNGANLVFTSAHGTGVQTWQIGVNAHRNTAFLEEVWSGSQLVGYRLWRKDGIQEVFDVSGRLVRETNPSGHNHHYGLDGKGRIASISDDFGAAITVIRDDEQGWEEYPWEDPDWDPEANDNEGGVVIPPSGSGNAAYTTDAYATTRAARIVAVSDGQREVIYDWDELSTNAGTNTDILKSVQIASGKTWTYVHGESVEGVTSGAKWITGVLGPDSQRWMTYKRNSAGQVFAEWRAAGPSGVGALERVNINSSSATDADGRVFSSFSSGGELVTSQNAPGLLTGLVEEHALKRLSTKIRVQLPVEPSIVATRQGSCCLKLIGETLQPALHTTRPAG